MDTETDESFEALLHTMNDTLRERSVELDDARTFLDSLVDSMHFGMVVVDREMRVVLVEPGLRRAMGFARRRDQRSSPDRPGLRTANGYRPAVDRQHIRGSRQSG